MQEQIVLVTGAAQGIGRAISDAFLRKGATVYLADLDAQAGHETLEQLKHLGGQAHFVQTDVREENEIKRVVERIGSAHNRLDVLVNNAGIGTHEPIESLSVQAFDDVLAVNLRAPFILAKYAAPLLRNADTGNIINIASTRALMSEPDTEPYSASKGGIVALTHALAVSLGPNIRVNAISPGWIEVSDWKKASARSQPNHRPQDLSQHPVGRVGRPDDIANACIFITSPEASFMTGQNLVIDGGMTIKMIYEH